MYPRTIFFLAARRYARLQWCNHVTARKANRRHLFIAPNGHIQFRRQRIGHRHADTVQAAGEGIRAAVGFVKFTARVQSGEHDFQHWYAFFRMNPNRNPAPVIFHRD